MIRAHLRPLLLFLATLACQHPRDPVAARVDGQVLGAERLAHLLVLAQPLPLTRAAAYELPSHWVSLAAFALRLAQGDSLLDSASVRDLMWYRVQQAVIAGWRHHLGARFDSGYALRLLEARQPALAPHAVAAVRRLASDPWTPSRLPDTLLTYRGGALRAARLTRHLRYLTPVTRAEMAEAGEAEIAAFLLDLAAQDLVVQQAESAGLGLSAADFAAIRAQCRDAIAALWRLTGLEPRASGPGSLAERQRAALEQVDRYLERAAARQAPLEPVPVFLAVGLLARADWDIVPEGVDRAVARARRLLAATASAGQRESRSP